jgi:hypothetical protein
MPPPEPAVGCGIVAASAQHEKDHERSRLVQRHSGITNYGHMRWLAPAHIIRA